MLLRSLRPSQLIYSALPSQNNVHKTFVTIVSATYLKIIAFSDWFARARVSRKDRQRKSAKNSCSTLFWLCAAVSCQSAQRSSTQRATLPGESRAVYSSVFWPTDEIVAPAWNFIFVVKTTGRSSWRSQPKDGATCIAVWKPSFCCYQHVAVLPRFGFVGELCLHFSRQNERIVGMEPGRRAIQRKAFHSFRWEKLGFVRGNEVERIRWSFVIVFCLSSSLKMVEVLCLNDAVYWRLLWKLPNSHSSFVFYFPSISCIRGSYFDDWKFCRLLGSSWHFKYDSNVIHICLRIRKGAFNFAGWK